MDVRHFAAAASMTAAGTWGWVTEALGFGNEMAQWATEWGEDYRSGFSPEDLPSNSAGAEFGQFFRAGTDPVDVAFGNWARSVGARDPSDPKSGFHSLPATDPAVRGGTERGSSNASSAPKGNSGGRLRGNDSTASGARWSISGGVVYGTRSCGSRIRSRGC